MRKPVIYITAPVATNMIRTLASWYPKEAAGFLFGSVDEQDTPWITHFVPITGQRTGTSFAFAQSAITRAYKNLPRSANHTHCLGFVHTHPYPEGIHPGGICQSFTDAKTQLALNFKYSLIIALSEESVGFGAWLSGFAAPVDIRVWTDGHKRTLNILSWVTRNRKLFEG